MHRPSPELLQQQGGGARGFMSPPDLPLVATARDALAYEYTGKSNRDSGAHVQAAYGATEVCDAKRMSVFLPLHAYC